MKVSKRVMERLTEFHDSTTSFRGLVKPSAVFAIRIDYSLKQDLDVIAEVTHIPRNSLIHMLLAWSVTHVDHVLEEIYSDLEKSEC